MPLTGCPSLSSFQEYFTQAFSNADVEISEISAPVSAQAQTGSPLFSLTKLYYKGDRRGGLLVTA